MWTITRYSHSCVRIESADSVLVIDPGMWSEPEAVAGADAVLLTHEHVDHINQQLGQMNERGRSIITNWVEHQTAVSFLWLTPGSVVTVGERSNLPTA